MPEAFVVPLTLEEITPIIEMTSEFIPPTHGFGIQQRSFAGSALTPRLSYREQLVGDPAAAVTRQGRQMPNVNISAWQEDFDAPNAGTHFRIAEPDEDEESKHGTLATTGN